MSNRKFVRRVLFVEVLESRQLLSVAADLSAITVKPAITVKASAGTSTAVDGYTPAEIRKAYGFDQASFGGVTGDGSGQTIAIVAAYDDPNIASDLSVFDKRFNLVDPPSFTKVSQTGGSTKGIAADAGWSSEIALDVEWAHAIAPKAKILLVEAKSDQLSDLMSAVDTARNASGVSVVSMSWGADEFWSETSFDKYFTTPAGHQGVTFVAASGDNGSWWGPSWPASSPNVLAVGGTTLRTNADGSYAGETGWSGSGGGISSYESQPAYQNGAQSTGGRTSPDVGYNANPYTGYAVYSSMAYQGYSGWSVVGGTSAGAPQWAGLVAIANQGRALQGASSLDGASGTLPMLYSLYHSPSTYAADFNDVTQGRSSWFLGAHTGYDGVTGLGTPKAAAAIAALAKVTKTSTSTSAAAVAAAAKNQKRAVAMQDLPAPVTTPTPATVAVVAPTSAAALVVRAAAREAVGAGLDGRAALQAGGVLLSAAVGASSSSGSTNVGLGGRGLFSTNVVRGFSDYAGAMVAQAPAAVTPGTAPLAAAKVAAAVVPGEGAKETPRIFRFARINWLSALADGWGELADESLSLTIAATAQRVRAWTITAAVAAFDVALLGWYFVRRRKGSGQMDIAVGDEPLPGRRQLGGGWRS
jgi:hypothetical protein